MSVHDLKFETLSPTAIIYDPLVIATDGNPGTGTTVQVTNTGTEALTGLGVFVTVATDVGDVDNPAQAAPETDYQDLLTMGTDTFLAITAVGGIRLVVPVNGGPDEEHYIRRGAGDLKTTKIAFIDLAAGVSDTFVIDIENPGAAPARRFFIDLVIE